MYKVKNLSASDSRKLEERINSFLISLDDLYISWDLIDIKITYLNKDNIIHATVIYKYINNTVDEKIYQENRSNTISPDLISPNIAVI